MIFLLVQDKKWTTQDVSTKTNLHWQRSYRCVGACNDSDRIAVYVCASVCNNSDCIAVLVCAQRSYRCACVCAAIISLCSCVQLQRSYRCVGATAIVSLVAVAAITSLYFCLPGFVQYRSIHTQAPAHRLCQFPHRVCVLAMASTHTEAATLASEVSVF